KRHPVSYHIDWTVCPFFPRVYAYKRGTSDKKRGGRTPINRALSRHGAARERVWCMDRWKKGRPWHQRKMARCPANKWRRKYRKAADPGAAHDQRETQYTNQPKRSLLLL